MPTLSYSINKRRLGLTLSKDLKIGKGIPTYNYTRAIIINIQTLWKLYRITTHPIQIQVSQFMFSNFNPWMKG